MNEHCEQAPKEYYIENPHTGARVTAHEWQRVEISGYDIPMKRCIYCGVTITGVVVSS